ncbi:sulfotransferase domain-containing protein [Sulfurimonas sp. ST-25]|uniref:sulfotransferase domain-containing protein n=1 Tax=Sulfurimonas sp. ST-25 TaxID=3400151 RepID=UPI003A8B570D
MSKKNLLDFIIVGAAKSGTTSIYNYLIQHPAIFMPECKEPHFLVKNKIAGKIDNWTDTEREYIALFETLEGNLIKGEASVFYLYFFDEAIKNIKKYIGEETKILIVLRNPLDRAFSAWRYVRKAGKEPHSFSESLRKEEGRKDLDVTPMMQYISCSLYYEQVKAYMENFNNVKVIIFEEFLNEKNKDIQEICRFLNIDDSFDFDTDSIHNANENDWKYNQKYTRLFTTDSNFKNFTKKILSHNIFIYKLAQKVFHRVFTSKKKYQLQINERQKYMKFFEEDISNLENLLQRDLDIWRKK